MYIAKAARRWAWGPRTVRATAAAVGPGAARRGAWDARTALGHHRRRRRAARGRRGDAGTEGGGGIKCYQNVLVSMPWISDLHALNIGSLCLEYRISMPRISDFYASNIGFL